MGDYRTKLLFASCQCLPLPLNLPHAAPVEPASPGLPLLELNQQLIGVLKVNIGAKQDKTRRHRLLTSARSGEGGAHLIYVLSVKSQDASHELQHITASVFRSVEVSQKQVSHQDSGGKNNTWISH